VAPCNAICSGTVHAVALAGGWLLTGGADGRVLRVRASGGKPVQIVKHPDEVRAVALSPDGKTCASAAGRDVSVHSADGKLLATLKGHTAEVRAIAFLPGGRLVSAGADRTARVWDIASAKETAVMVGHAGTVTCVTIGAVGKLVVTGSTDRTARWWDASTGKELGARNAGSEVHAVAWEAGKLVAGTSGGQVRVWDSRTDASATTFDGPEGTVRAVHLSKDGTVSAVAARGAIAWRWAAGKRWHGKQDGPVTAACVASDGALAAVTAEGVRLIAPK
jgi:WD40 repeat protein